MPDGPLGGTGEAAVPLSVMRVPLSGMPNVHPRAALVVRPNESGGGACGPTNESAVRLVLLEVHRWGPRVAPTLYPRLGTQTSSPACMQTERPTIASICDDGFFPQQPLRSRST